MPDTLDSTGLTVKTLTEISDELKDDFRDIYGSDINVDQNSPDGQMINIYAQGGVDYREQLTSIYNSFDPDNAVGTTLDARVRLNNIERRGGSYTIQPIDITVSQTVSLDGLDDEENDLNGTGYTIEDTAGNQYILIDSVVLTPGTVSKNFRAKEIGQIESTINTITTQVTIILGVTSVNNSSAALSVGENEETDGELRVRRSASIGINANGYLNGLQAKLLNISGVIDAKVYENISNVTDSDGIPGHSIWAIVEGGGNTNIGTAIYESKTDGCGMKGDATPPLNCTCYALYDSDINLTYGLGVLTGTGTGSPTVSGGNLDLRGGAIKAVSYSATLNADFTQTGTVRINIIPNYSGTPASDQYLFSISNGVTLNNLIELYHNTAGNLFINIFDSSGVAIISTSNGSWSPTAGALYEVELNMDITAGATRVFINGIQVSATYVQTGTRTSTADTFIIGNSRFLGATSDFQIPDIGVFNAVQHTANYTPKNEYPDPSTNVVVPIATPANQIFEAKFTRPTAENLYIQFNLKQTIPNYSFDTDAIKAYIVANQSYGIGESAYTSTLTCIAQDGVDTNGGGGAVLALEISNNGSTWLDSLDTSTKDRQFTLDVSNISITVI